MKLLILSLVFILTLNSYAQEFTVHQLDSLYHLFARINNVEAVNENKQNTGEVTEIIKCGLDLVTTIKRNLNNFSPDQQNVLSKILDRSVRQVSVVSPGGFFRVHYDTLGGNRVGYDINLFLQALDSSYNFEVNYLGYQAPPQDGSQGGDGKYDVYVQDLFNTYGYTTPEQNVGVSNWTSYINIDNDFGTDFYTHGIDAARVTAAHEFHHAIQMGSYAPIDPSEPYRNNDRWFYEITSTAFEEFVFDYVNDYYAYMPHYFNNPSKSIVRFTSGVDAYDLAIWNIYVQKNFGFDIIKSQWDRIPTMSAIKSIALSFIDDSTNLGNELNKFGIWCYFTGNRNIFPDEYFEEADEYPMLVSTADMDFNSLSQVYNMTVNPAANYFLNIDLLPTSENLFTIITNSDWQKVIDNYTQSLDFSFTVFNDSSAGNKTINEYYSVTFNRENQQYWNNAGILNNEVVYGDTAYNIPELESETFAYPTPYKKSSAGKIRFAFQSYLIKGDEVNLNIYSSGLEIMYSGNPSIRASYLKNSNKYCEVIIDGSEINFATGVYIYVIKSGDQIWKGKLVIFND